MKIKEGEKELENERRRRKEKCRGWVLRMEKKGKKMGWTDGWKSNRSGVKRKKGKR